MSKLNKGTDTSTSDYDFLLKQDADYSVRIPNKDDPATGFIGLPNAVGWTMFPEMDEEGDIDHVVSGNAHAGSYLGIYQRLANRSVIIVPGPENAIDFTYILEKADLKDPDIKVTLSFDTVKQINMNLDHAQSQGRVLGLVFENVVSTDTGYLGRVTYIGFGELTSKKSGDEA